MNVTSNVAAKSLKHLANREILPAREKRSQITHVVTSSRLQCATVLGLKETVEDGSNVVESIEGTVPLLKNQIIVIRAHYGTVGWVEWSQTYWT